MLPSHFHFHPPIVLGLSP